MASVDLDTIRRLGDLYRQLAERLVVLADSYEASIAANDALTAALTAVNETLVALGLPTVSIPVEVDPGLVQAISDATAIVNRDAEKLQAAQPPN